MIDIDNYYDILYIRTKTEYKVVRFEGGTATFPPGCFGGSANLCGGKIIKTFAKNGGGFLFNPLLLC